jgi:ubiquinone/menaquinone biosynthesis C-methylase UbiE
MAAIPEIRFNDGAAYEKFMGVWSRSVGETFLDWLAPAKGASWIDVGCGNGAFTELLVERTAPSRIIAVDPSEEQLSFARERHKAGLATFAKGDAMALAAEDRSFDAAVMALVIFFVPDPARGVAEMVRVTRPGGTIAAYAWDMLGGGFPLQFLYDELSRLGIDAPMPPSAEASRIGEMDRLWRSGGIVDVETRSITVERTFTDFETMWAINMSGPRTSAIASTMSEEMRGALKEAVRARMPVDGHGRITTSARANAVKGRLPI